MGGGDEEKPSEAPAPRKKRGRKAASPRALGGAATPAVGRPAPRDPAAGAPIKKRKRQRLKHDRIPSRRDLAAARIGLPRETAKERGIKTSPPVPSEKLPPEVHPWERKPREASAWVKRAVERIDKAEAAEAEKRAELASKEEVKSRRGRPSKFEKWMCDEVVEFGRLGMEVHEFADELNVHRDTLYEWAKVHREFSDSLARAIQASEAFHTRHIRSQLHLPSQAANAASYLSYMGRRFKSWREASDLNVSVTTPVSVALEQARKRAKARGREAAAA